MRIFPHEDEKRDPGRSSADYDVSSMIPLGGITSQLLRMVRTQTFRRDVFKLKNRWPKELQELEALAPDVALMAERERSRRGAQRPF